jgi:hypothetical protein
MDTGFAIRIRATEKQRIFQSIFPGPNRLPLWPDVRRVSRHICTRLHIAVIGHFIFIVIRTVATWRARAIEAAVADLSPVSTGTRTGGQGFV